MAYAIRRTAVNIMKVGFDASRKILVGEPVNVTEGFVQTRVTDVSASVGLLYLGWPRGPFCHPP